MSEADIGKKRSKFSIVAKAGLTHESLSNSDFPGVDVSFEGEPAAGLSLSYNLDSSNSIDLEFIRGGATGDFSNGFRSGSLTIDIDSAALYWSQKSVGEWYISYKIGLLQEKLSSDNVSTETDTGLSFGIGGGYRFSSSLELGLEYVKVESDIGWVLLSARYTPNL